MTYWHIASVGLNTMDLYILCICDWCRQTLHAALTTNNSQIRLVTFLLLQFENSLFTWGQTWVKSLCTVWETQWEYICWIFGCTKCFLVISVSSHFYQMFRSSLWQSKGLPLQYISTLIQNIYREQKNRFYNCYYYFCI